MHNKLIKKIFMIEIMALLIGCANFTYAAGPVIGPGEGMDPPPSPTPNPPVGSTGAKGYKIEGAEYYDYVGYADDGSLVDKWHIIFGHLGGMLGIGGENNNTGKSNQNSSGLNGPSPSNNGNNNSVTPGQNGSGPQVQNGNFFTDFLGSLIAPPPPTANKEKVSPDDIRQNSPPIGESKLNKAEQQMIQESIAEAAMHESLINSMTETKDSPDRMREEETTIAIKETKITAPTAAPTKEKQKETKKETTKSKFNFTDAPKADKNDGITIINENALDNLVTPELATVETTIYQSTGPSVEPTTERTEKPTEVTTEYTEPSKDIETTEPKETTAEEKVEEEELKKDDMSDEDLEEHEDSDYEEEKGEEMNLGEDKGDNQGKNTGIKIFELKNTDGNFSNKPIINKVGFNNMQKRVIFGICGGIFLLGFIRYFGRYIVIRFVKNKYLI